MQIPALLSDLKSLSVCGHEEALTLVSVHNKNPHGTTKTAVEKGESDPDLERAKELVDLFYKVKVQYKDYGVDEELLQARRDVDSVRRALGQGD